MLFRSVPCGLAALVTNSYQVIVFGSYLWYDVGRCSAVHSIMEIVTMGIPVCLVECLKEAKKKSTSDYVVANIRSSNGSGSTSSFDLPKSAPIISM